MTMARKKEQKKYILKDKVFIDWLSFTLSREYYPDLTEKLQKLEGLLPKVKGQRKEQIEGNITQIQDDIVKHLSKKLEIVLGYGVTEKRDHGCYSYTQAYNLGNNCGLVALGGKFQQGTIWVSITGEGCDVARKGWEHALHDWVTGSAIPRFKINRIDIAYDCYDYTVDKAIADYDQGLFNAGGRLPSIEQKGDWRTPKNENGRTVCIGHRGNGKFCRIYEKGKQLDDPNYSELVRIECEWLGKSRTLTLDMLTSPDKYLAGVYPALNWIHQTQERIKTTTQKDPIPYDKAVETVRHQYGPLIWHMLAVEDSLETVFEKIVRPGKPPARVIIPDELEDELSNR